MDNHEYFERFEDLSKTETFQNALEHKGITIGFTAIDIEKYANSNRLEELKEEAKEKRNKSNNSDIHHKDDELEI